VNSEQIHIDAGDTAGPQGGASRRLIAAVVMVVLAGGGAVAVMVATGGDDPQRPGVAAAVDDAGIDHDYLIPAGTGARIDGGEIIDILPAELVMTVGETIRIVNDDDRGHTVGVFYVGPGEELRQTFTAPGELSGECSVHSSGQFVLRVVAA
jgi:plastocyanin